METRLKSKYVIILLSVALFQCKIGVGDQELIQNLEEISSTYIADKRVKLFHYEIDGKVVKGITDQPLVKEAVHDLLNNSAWTDSLELVPAKGLGADTLAYVNLSVANIRSKPAHSAELATQALMGTPLRILYKDGSWYCVQTPDKYIAYVDGGALSFDYRGFKNEDKMIFIETFGEAYQLASATSTPVSDLVFGDLLGVKGESGAFYQVALPDQREAFVPKAQLSTLEDFLSKAKENDVENIAVKLMGVPYLWGGTSSKGVDCSGFTRTVFFNKGLYLPRDASQQALVGERIDLDKNFSNLEKGDLLFFGKNESKVTHVAIYLGHQRFIHSSGMVRYASFDSTATDYDAYNLKRLLFAKRVLNKADVNHLNKETLY